MLVGETAVTWKSMVLYNNSIVKWYFQNKFCIVFVMSHVGSNTFTGYLTFYLKQKAIVSSEDLMVFASIHSNK